jgi:hypothetical protein
MKLSLVKYDKNCWPIQDEDGVVHYMALSLSNDRWSLVDSNDRRVTDKTFVNPQAAYDEVKIIGEARQPTAPVNSRDL